MTLFKEPKPKEKIRLSTIEKKQENSQQKQYESILEETCIIESEEYISYDLDLGANEVVKGEITSDKEINVFFLTKHGFRCFENGEDFSYEYGAENVLEKRITFQPSRTARRYLVVENEGEDSAEVVIHLFV